MLNYTQSSNMHCSCVYVFGFILLGLIPVTLSDLNLYLDSTETYRLLGITAELYYVRKGIINNYALSFVLPINPDVHEIYFHWQSLRHMPPAIFYSMSFEVSNPRAMLMPVANISKEGTVPKSLSVFSIKFPCTGNISADVEVLIQMNISIFSASNFSVLNFKRRKTCLIDFDRQRPFIKNIIPNKVPYNTQRTRNDSSSSVTESKDHSTSVRMSTHIFYIAVGCACAIILLIALAVTVFYLNTQKGGSRGYSERIKYYDSTSSQALTKQQSQSFLRPETPVESSYKGSTRNFSCGGASPIPESIPPDPKDILAEIAIDRNRISLGEILMEGTFGRIYQGTLLSEGGDSFCADQEILVKTVTDQARTDQVQLFLTESLTLMGHVHKNIFPVIGSCLDPGLSPFIIYPFPSEGNLKKFLLKCRVSETGSLYSLSTQQLVYLALQILKGVQYLHKKKIIHKDIATRNCMIYSDLELKITDNALSRDVFPADYNCLGDNENRPVKWQPIEALIEKRFSIASDVWSIGVTMWELMSLAQQPYSEIDAFEMSAYLREGYRIAQPVNCPDELFSIMFACWAGNPDERPKIPQLLVYLQNFYEALGRYI